MGKRQRERRRKALAAKPPLGPAPAAFGGPENIADWPLRYYTRRLSNGVMHRQRRRVLWAKGRYVTKCGTERASDWHFSRTFRVKLEGTPTGVIPPAGVAHPSGSVMCLPLRDGDVLAMGGGVYQVTYRFSVLAGQSLGVPADLLLGLDGSPPAAVEGTEVR